MTALFTALAIKAGKSPAEIWSLPESFYSHSHTSIEPPDRIEGQFAEQTEPAAGAPVAESRDPEGATRESEAPKNQPVPPRPAVVRNRAPSPEPVPPRVQPNDRVRLPRRAGVQLETPDQSASAAVPAAVRRVQSEVTSRREQARTDQPAVAHGQRRANPKLTPRKMGKRVEVDASDTSRALPGEEITAAAIDHRASVTDAPQTTPAAALPAIVKARMHRQVGRAEVPYTEAPAFAAKDRSIREIQRIAIRNPGTEFPQETAGSIPPARMRRDPAIVTLTQSDLREAAIVPRRESGVPYPARLRAATQAPPTANDADPARSYRHLDDEGRSIPQPAVQVSIGKIEIREPTPEPRPLRRPAAPGMGLREYLDRRFGVQRRE